MENLAVGDVVGDYRITAVARRGGMGLVYRAVQSRLHRQVALKVIAPEVAMDADFRARFQREAELAASIEHPHVIPVYAAGELDTGQLYLAMRWVEGADLRQLLAHQAPFALDRAVEVLAPVARALDAAHRRGLVHRDVKPANILIAERDGAKSEQVYLADFGIARSTTDTLSLTRTGQFVGTLGYVAPELFQGDHGGPAADIYALGCVLYETLTGARPFRGESDLATMRAHLDDPIPSVSAVRPEVARAMDDVLQIALAKDPAARYAHAGLLAEALERMRGDRPPGTFVDGHSQQETTPHHASPAPAVADHVTAGRPRDLSTELPIPLSSFVGRDRELREVCALAGVARLVTLAGAGGVGKTRLARAAAERLRGQGWDGVGWVALAALRDRESVARELGRVLGVSEQPGRAMRDSLVDAIGGRRLLIVIDNCEHLVGAVAELLDGLLRLSPGVVVLATSREPLGVEGERVYRVPSLSLPESDGGAGAGEAVALFLERAREQRPEFVLDAENAAAVAAIVQRLDGIPLAIELAAARLRVLGIADLQSHLEQSFRLLRAGSRTALPRHQTLAAMIDWSYELLAEPERVVLARLSVFLGGFDLPAAEAVCADGTIEAVDVIDVLGMLADKSLVQVDDVGRSVRYRLLETVREYAAGKLADRVEPAEDAARSAHRDHYLALAEVAKPQLQRHDQLIWLDRLETERDNLRAALRYCLEDPDPEPGLRLASALRRFWKLRGHGLEGAAAISAQLDRPEASGPTLGRAAALTEAVNLLGEEAGEFRTVEALGEEAVAIARANESDAVTAEALVALGWARLQHGRATETIVLFEEAVSLARQTGDPALLGYVLYTQSAALLNSGSDMRPSLEEAIRLFRAVGSRSAEGRGLELSGVAALDAGDLRTARAHLQQAAQIADELRLTDSRLTAVINLGFAALLDGDDEQARAAFTDAIPLTRDRRKGALPYALLGLALSTSVADPERATQLHGTVDRLLAESGAHLDRLEGRLRGEDRERLVAQLGPHRFDHCLTAGRSQPLDALITDSSSPATA